MTSSTSGVDQPPALATSSIERSASRSTCSERVADAVAFARANVAILARARFDDAARIFGSAASVRMRQSARNPTLSTWIGDLRTYFVAAAPTQSSENVS